MPDSFQTLADLVTINDKNLAEIEVTDLLDDAPLMRALAGDVASNGTTHKYTKETGAPVVGFRSPNTGRENSKSSDTLVSTDLKLLDASFSVDKGLADAFRDGPEAYIAREARRHLKASFFAAEKQFLNGTGEDADGFSGMADGANLDGLGDAQVVDAGGTTATTGSSVWLIRTNDDGNDVTAITGQAGQIEIGDAVVTVVEDTGNGGRFTAYHVPILGWLGLQVGSIHSIVRIANLTEDAGKGLTDELIYEALSVFPASKQPNLIVGNRRSLRQLRASRSATNATGAPAPRPTEVEGIPIITTDAITSTEALLA